MHPFVGIFGSFFFFLDDMTFARAFAQTQK
jgi:hypothetical protein